MLFSLGHGQHAVQEGAPAARRPQDAPASPTPAQPLAAVAPGTMLEAAQPAAARFVMADAADAPPEAPMVSAAAPVAETGKFRYYFPDAEGLPERADMPALLDALADSMVGPEDPADPADKNAAIPAVFTYFGQFIDHDITANTDRETAPSIIQGAIAPLPREQVQDAIVNLRDGSLELDSLYGDTLGQGAFATKLASLMRFPGNRAKMRLAFPSKIGDRVPLPPPDDNASDLLRLGFLLKNGLLTLEELETLVPPELRDQFIDKATGEPVLARAIIGDARNDENLLVAQFHVLMLRLHNKLADATGGRSFRKARRLTQWHYQWLVIHSYLKTLCDPAVVEEVLALEAPLYSGFYEKHGVDGPKMPMPLEFSVAAFRFGHSMVRAVYDHNRVFGEPVEGTQNLIPEAPFTLLFRFTGNGRMNDQPDVGQLPQNWVIEWERFINPPDPAHPTRAARKIDTDLAPPLQTLTNEANAPALDEDVRKLFKSLARRNLRRGYRLNLPTAQACIAAVNAAGYKPIDALTPEQLRSGGDARRAAVEAGGFDTATPLWFYVLKEAEVMGDGERLGPLGSHLVANTLIGLIVNDPDSFWNADGGPWSPAKFDADNPIDSLERLARFCGML